MSGFNGIVSTALRGDRLQPDEALALASCDDLELLGAAAGRLRDQGHGPRVSYSPKVFIPLTQLCRDVCHYCTFAQTPKKLEAPYLSPEQVLAIARAGAAAGCHEALFTLGDKPELRYATARKALAALGHDSTLSYLEEMARLVFTETGLLPHLNAGVMGREELLQLRGVSASQGLMLESVSPRLLEPGQPHHGSPDKQPAARLATIAAAGQAALMLRMMTEKTEVDDQSSPSTESADTAPRSLKTCWILLMMKSCDTGMIVGRNWSSSFSTVAWSTKKDPTATKLKTSGNMEKSV